MERTIKIALVGAGMFGGDVHLRAYADLQRFGIAGQLGDLTISVIKRDIGIKDMGATIPGHGGILDRMDSMCFAAPIFFHIVRYFYVR